MNKAQSDSLAVQTAKKVAMPLKQPKYMTVLYSPFIPLELQKQ